MNTLEKRIIKIEETQREQCRLIKNLRNELEALYNCFNYIIFKTSQVKNK